MTRATFFKHFELLADQADAVAKMRELVWQLAVQGKLLSQNPKDEPATRLVEQIREQKSRLIKAGKIRKTLLLPPIEESDHHFKIPPSWAWVHMNDIGDWGAGSTPERGRSEFYGGDIPWLKSGELNDGFVTKSEEYLTKLALEKCSLRLNQPGDVLIAMYGATVGKVAILEIEATTNQAVCACTCFDGVFNRYLFLLLKAYKQRFIDESAGAAQPNFSKDKIIRTIAPLPPLAEQRRIVAKVDELMALCDELEQRQQARQHASGLLQQSALHHLLAAREPQTFAAAWQRVRDHFHLLHDTPDAIPQLRQAILSLAVQGHVVQRIEKDGTGGEILNGIGAKPIAPADAPFLPDHWNWAALGDLVVKMDSGWSPACPPEPAADNEWGVLKTTAVQSVRYLQEHNKVLPKHLKPRPEHEVMKGDILITRAGPKNRVGISCVVESTRPRLMISDKIVRFQLRPIIFPRFAALCLNAGYSSEVLERLKSGMAESQMNISQPKLKTTPLPVPPFAEQKRIVARVEELLRWCDTLEAQLHQTRTLGAHLLASTLHQLLAA